MTFENMSKQAEADWPEHSLLVLQASQKQESQVLAAAIPNTP